MWSQSLGLCSLLLSGLLCELLPYKYVSRILYYLLYTMYTHNYVPIAV